jgi:DUF4097 and DUF4098 domain-containing protein YvlB
MSKYTFIPVLLIAAWPAFAGQSIDQRQPASARGTVEVANVAGTVNVRGTTKDEVHVAGELASNARLEFSVDGARTTIKVVLPRGTMHHGSSDLDIEIPAGSDLTVSTVSADAGVHEVRGALDLQTVSGNIETEAFDKDANLRTVSGDVTVRGNRGSAVLTIVTVSGNVDVKNTGGDANASSVSGDLNLRLTTVGRSRLRTTSGDITMYGELTKDARVDSETVSGDTSFYLGGSRDADYDLETATGDISNCFGPEPASRKYGPGEDLRFRQGTTDAGLRARTLSGDITLCKN